MSPKLAGPLTVITSPWAIDFRPHDLGTSRVNGSVLRRKVCLGPVSSSRVVGPAGLAGAGGCALSTSGGTSFLSSHASPVPARMPARTQPNHRIRLSWSKTGKGFARARFYVHRLSARPIRLSNLTVHDQSATTSGALKIQV